MTYLQEVKNTVAAENREQFIKSWEAHVNELGELAYSLPPNKVKEFFVLQKEILLFVKEAANHTFIDCEFFRLTPSTHQCIEGDCYKGDTKKTEAFGNCCMKCPKAMTCDAGCMKTEELKYSIVKREVKKKCR